MLKPALQKAAREAAEELARDTGDGGPAILVGLPWGDAPFVYNAVALLDRGRIEAVRIKNNLPNYGVFDEKRVFAAGPMPEPIDFRGVRLGVPICEDIWSDEVCDGPGRDRRRVCCSCRTARPLDRQAGHPLSIVVARVAETGLPLAYVNQVGGQDELVFDGASFVLNGDGTLAVQMPACEQEVAMTGWRREPGAGAVAGARSQRSRRVRPPTISPRHPCATTSPRTAFPASCSGCPVASIRRWWRRSPSMRSAPNASAA